MIQLRHRNCSKCGKPIVPNLKWAGRYSTNGGHKVYEIVYACPDYRWYNRHSKWYAAVYGGEADIYTDKFTLDDIDPNGVPFTIEGVHG